MAEDADELLQRFMDEELEEHPVLATVLGVDGHDDRLGDLSAGGFERRATADRRWLDAFASLPDDDLALDQRIDRDLVLSTLRGRIVLHDWVAWRRNPDTYLNPGLQGVFALFLHRLRPEPELAADAAARLRAVPDVLADGRANLDPDLTSAVLVERALGQARAAVRYTRELLPDEATDPEPRAMLADAGAVAASAFESFADFLADLATRAKGSFALGETRYTALLQQRELLDVDTAGLRARGESMPRASTRPPTATGGPWCRRSTAITPRARRTCGRPTRTGPAGHGSSSPTTSW